MTLPTNYGMGRSPLQDLEDRGFRQKARQLLLKRVQAATRAQPVVDYTPGPTAGRFGVMSGSQPTAQDMNAMTQKKAARALYGKYGKGGLERERLRSDVLMRKEGYRSAEKVAGIGAGATTGAARIRAGATKEAAKIGARATTKAAGIRARGLLDATKLQTAAREKEATLRFGPEGPAMTAAKAGMYHYVPIEDDMGETRGVQTFYGGKPLKFQSVPGAPTSSNEGATSPPKRKTFNVPSSWTPAQIQWWNSLTPEQQEAYRRRAREMAGGR
ncbi:MAG: hypothetical protein JRI80_04865 [Deltaproteobacteria bacterium]|nr:hypothetical protein [Deltaproteobacteria bacterium]